MSGPVAGRGFPATRLSAVRAAASADPVERERALGRIAETYWLPVYTYLRLRWRLDRADGEDLTQEFFHRLLERDLLAGFDPGKARLRTFLRVCADRLVQNHRRDALAAKRGGGQAPVAIDLEGVERELAAARGEREPEPEALFAQAFARSLFQLALADLRAQCAGTPRAVRLEVFRRHDLAPEAEGSARPTYAATAASLGLKPSDVTNHLAWARREFRRLALERLREMTRSEDEFRREARALLGVQP